jgi:hypothetical protein
MKKQWCFTRVSLYVYNIDLFISIGDISKPNPTGLYTVDTRTEAYKPIRTTASLLFCILQKLTFTETTLF